MKNFVEKGEVLSLTMPYARTSGQGVKVGAAIFGVVVSDAASGAKAQVRPFGVYTLAKTAAQTYAVGDKLYWDDTAKLVTSTSTSNLFIGVAVAAAAGADATATVALRPNGA